jgi:hypothetical protein
MDYWDPAVTDGLARDREVILLNNAGVSSSSGRSVDLVRGNGRWRRGFHQGAGTHERRCLRLFETLIPIRTRLALFRTNSDDIERIKTHGYPSP